MTITWERALADCEARIDTALAGLERGEPVQIEPFSPDEIDGPLPVVLARRAPPCRDRGAELEERLERELERIRSELRRLPRMPARSVTPASTHKPEHHA